MKCSEAKSVPPLRDIFDCQALREAGKHSVIGVDEAGRGALAGPVVAAAVCLPKAFYESKTGRRYAAELQLRDSKKLTSSQRLAVFNALEGFRATQIMTFAWAAASVEEIETLNILGATRLAMARALETLVAQTKRPLSYQGRQPYNDTVNLGGNSPLLLIDGKPLKPFRYTHRAIVKGDTKSLAIASASIIAKVSRDKLLVDCEKGYPQYGFAHHKGYGTAAHRKVILQVGPSCLHRRKFLRKLIKIQESEYSYEGGGKNPKNPKRESHSVRLLERTLRGVGKKAARTGKNTE